MQSTHSSQATTSSDLAALTRLLDRLTPKILSTAPSNPLRHSPFERQKTLTNLEYARTLLLRAENTAAGIKAQSRKHATQEQLGRQRAAIRKLSERLWELGQLSDDGWGSEDEDDEGEGEGEVDDVLRDILEEDDAGEAKTQPLQSVGGASQAKSASARQTTSPVDSASQIQAQAQSHHSAKNELLSSALRSRTRSSNPGNQAHDSAKTTSSTFGNTGNEKSTLPALESAEATHNELTSSLVDLAMQLKRSAQAFSADLELDTQVLGTTEDALGKNKTGLDVATQRMGVLRKMSEGRWWWGRMVLYAGIAALWFVLILFVFLGPKIRF